MRTAKDRQAWNAASLAVIVASLSVVPCASWAQASAAAFTTGFRYDSGGRLTGTIRPDPDGAGPLSFAAIRNSYDAYGRLTRREMGQLVQWQSESVAPSAWSGFSVIEAFSYEYDALSRKSKEVIIGDDGATYGVTQFSYDEYGRLDCVAVRMNPAAFSAPPASACDLGTAGTYGPDRITRHTYDGLNRLVQLQRGYATAYQQDYSTYVYSANGLRRYITDANGNVSESSMTAMIDRST